MNPLIKARKSRRVRPATSNIYTKHRIGKVIINKRKRTIK